jgi:hypothetical protein
MAPNPSNNAELHEGMPLQARPTRHDRWAWDYKQSMFLLHFLMHFPMHVKASIHSRTFELQLCAVSSAIISGLWGRLKKPCLYECLVLVVFLLFDR